jgi:hypothetical protein
MLRRQLLIVRADQHVDKICLSRDTVRLPDNIVTRPDAVCDPPRPIINESDECDPLFRRIETGDDLLAAHQLFEKVAVRAIEGETTRRVRYHEAVKQWLVRFFASDIETSNIRSVINRKTSGTQPWTGPEKYRQTALTNGWVVAIMIQEVEVP